MEYHVIGTDGQEYGPATVDTLKLWADQGRLLPNTILRDSGGFTMPANSVQGIFAPVPVESRHSQAIPTAPMPAPGFRPVTTSSGRVEYVDDDKKPLFTAIGLSALSIVFFFVLHRIGLIFAASSMYYAIQAQNNGNKYGVWAIVVAAIGLVVVGAGWYVRLTGGGV